MKFVICPRTTESKPAVRGHRTSPTARLKSGLRNDVTQIHIGDEGMRVLRTPRRDIPGGTNDIGKLRDKLQFSVVRTRPDRRYEADGRFLVITIVRIRRAGKPKTHAIRSTASCT